MVNNEQYDMIVQIKDVKLVYNSPMFPGFKRVDLAFGGELLTELPDVKIFSKKFCRYLQNFYMSAMGKSDLSSTFFVKTIICIDPKLIVEIEKIIDVAEIWISHFDLEISRSDLYQLFAVQLPRQCTHSIRGTILNDHAMRIQHE